MKLSRLFTKLHGAAVLTKVWRVAAHLPQFSVTMSHKRMFLLCIDLRTANCAFREKALQLIPKPGNPDCDASEDVDDVHYAFSFPLPCDREETSA